ncbi:MAG: bifunctional DNA-formamidopyrimidine glycosylase/DNA-(apurinic or apyrimidinic site) lyase [Candidatus Omnitrophica bacterium]|nr:bifunctional DNA-formamidopyrimidine glycosylase/DNA-(apurinic or apyrimidinic site) lyase [Candidatus Omnitrophota bacterium]
MPELPEVETIKRDLEKKILGKKIIAIEADKPKVIKEPSLDKFRKGLVGKRPKEVIRKAKVLIIKFEDNKFLVIHLRISGWLQYGKKEDKARVLFKLSDGKYLNYMDQRLLGELRLRSDYKDLKFIQRLGPEPFELSLKEFKDIIRTKKTKIKPLLMDQAVISGIGNIYAQESLFESKILPTRQSLSLKDREISLLYKNIRGVLNKAIQNRGSSVDTYRDIDGRTGGMEEKLRVYGRQNEPCFKCRRSIKKINLGGRGTCFCPSCQH